MMGPGTATTHKERGRAMNNRPGMNEIESFSQRSHDAAHNMRNLGKGRTMRLHNTRPHRSIQHWLLAFVVGFATLFSTVEQTIPASAAAGTNTLYAYERLYPGQRLISAGGQYHLVMQGDGNLVIYAPNNVPIWSSRTNGKSGAYLSMQGDGNLVIYHYGVAVWASGTNGNSGARLIMQADSNLVLYTPAGRPLWCSKCSAPTGLSVQDASAGCTDGSRAEARAIAASGQFTTPRTAYADDTFANNHWTVKIELRY